MLGNSKTSRFWRGLGSRVNNLRVAQETGTKVVRIAKRTSRERESQRESVCVCVRERERDRETEGESEIERVRARARASQRV